MDTQMNEMRQQMATLKKKLEQQEIVNDRIIRQSMKRNVMNINNRNIVIFVLCLLVIPFTYFAFVLLNGFSLALWIGTSVFMLICCGFTLWNGRDMRSTHLWESDLLETRKKVALAMKHDSDWLFFGIPMLAIWLGWLFYEVYQKGGGSAEMAAIMIGGVVGTIIGLTLHFKTRRTYQDIIDQIEDITRA